MSAIVTMQHVRAAGMTLTGKPLCARGIRAWFASHDLDFAAFLREGMPAEAAEATGDAFALQAAQFARVEANEDGNGQEQ